MDIFSGVNIEIDIHSITIAILSSVQTFNSRVILLARFNFALFGGFARLLQLFSFS
jgi:hypothetical protein